MQKAQIENSKNLEIHIDKITVFHDERVEVSIAEFILELLLFRRGFSICEKQQIE